MCSLIKALNLSFSYSSSDAFILRNVSLEVDEGDFVSIVGGNGSGKSTFARMFNALITPTSGSVVVCGIDTIESNMIFEIRKQVGMVFQNPDSQIVATLVEEDVAFAMENLCYPREEMEDLIEKALKSVDMLNHKKSLVYNLSGGQKQRVAIAGVLAMNPKCIIFDEATSMLDPEGRKKVIEIMKRLNENGTTIINITHNMEEVVYSKKVVVLVNGQILKVCSPAQLFADEDVLKRAHLKSLPVTELINKLSLNGLIQKQTVLNVDKCVELIAEMLS